MSRPSSRTAVLEQVRAARTGRLTELLQEVGCSVPPARGGEETFGAVAHGFQHCIPTTQVAFGELVLDRSSNDPGGRSKRLDLCRAPIPLVLGVLEPDEPPPPTLDEDRNRQNRERACKGERVTLARRAGL